MAPATRARPAHPQPASANSAAAKGRNQKEQEVIVLSSDSDEEEYNAKGKGKGRVVKRQKTTSTHEMDEDIIMTDADAPKAPPTPPPSVAASSSAKNAHLKGRKRFAADFADLKAQGLECGGMAVAKIQKGDDDGMMDLVIVDRGKNDERVVACNVTITDTSEYPKSHTIITYSEDPDLPGRVASALSSLESAPPMPIADALERLLLSLSGTKPRARPASPTKPLAKGKSFATNNTASDSDAAEGGSEDDDEYDGYFSDADYASAPSASHAAAALAKAQVTARLQRDFLETVSSEYRPGLIPFTAGTWDPAADFAVSVSLPTVRLTDTIPAQALVAWDRRLLGSPHARHLVLLISGFNSGAGASVHNVYPPLTPEGGYVRKGMQLRFQVGVCGRYKPSRAHAVEVGRTFGLVGRDAEDEIREERERAKRAREAQIAEWGAGDPEADASGEFGDEAQVQEEEQEEEEEEDEGRFERFALSSSLEALLDTQLARLIGIRRTYGVGWAGAEMMVERVEREQRAEGEVWGVYRKEILAADKAETREERGGTLPHDPLRALGKGEDVNLPYVAFCYLVRRLTLCTRYCLVCHYKLNTEFEALKPYVCDRPLCTYQYYAHNRGASLEYEIIHNPETVDMLVSLTYCSAAEGALDEPLPVGMALRVPPPDQARITAPAPTHPHYGHQQAPPPPPVNVEYVVGTDGLVDFDTLPITHMRASIAGLIDTLPSIDDMKRHLERKVKPGKSKPRLKEMENGTVLPAAWKVLRWCVASCTAYLEEMSSSEDQRIQGLDASWRQFRFSVGAPDAEAKFMKAQQMAITTDANAKRYPSLYAFHGSALKNWHSIIRHGLWYKTVVNGRAFGDGVYLAKESQTSMGHYAAAGRACWRKSKLGPTSCTALAEVVNLPSQFVSSSPHYVLKDTEWIMCRYLLVKGLEAPLADSALKKKKKDKAPIPFVKLDPTQATTLMGKALQVPQPGHQIAELVSDRMQELVDEDHDETDAYIFADRPPPEVEVIDVTDDDEPTPVPAKGKGKGKGASLVAAVSSVFKGSGGGGGASGSGSGSSAPPKGPPKDDWKHDEAYVQRTLEMMMSPPLDSTPSSTMAVQRELKAMLKEQDKAMVSAGGLKELGWYMPPDLVGDNLFQWIVEMHSFDETLPIAKDLKREKINSIIFEIRFPSTYPIGPPFFRIITPRFLPFIHGGGGHVTGGGSICMDLLTSDGWLPSYSISAVLMQIKLAISNLDPRPARLASNWNSPYAVSEALAGFKRAAATHNWTVPDGLDKLVR